MWWFLCPYLRYAKSLCLFACLTRRFGIGWAFSSKNILRPLLLTWINFNPRMENITCPVKCGVNLRIHSQTSTVPPLKFGNGYMIPYHILWWMQLDQVIYIRNKINLNSWSLSILSTYPAIYLYVSEHIKAEIKWLPFCWWRFRMHFRFSTKFVFWLKFHWILLQCSN